VVLNNLKEGVIKPDIYEPELNAVYETILDHYGVVADPARLRRSEQGRDCGKYHKASTAYRLERLHIKID
jgi:hypothetical protein